MCGLVGIFDPQGRRAIDEAVLERMNDTLRHRGPDGGGSHFGPGIALGHRRLAIIDVGGGHQPMTNEDGTVIVVFNGEIYNFHELVRELEEHGHAFHTRCDTEVIVHAWEQWGPRSVERFRGMFAFALWDEGRETLFLARDHLGKKPLYWARAADGRLVFGSELKAVMAHGGVDPVIAPEAVEDFFALGYIADPRSIYATVRKLPPAHRLVWRRGQPEPAIDPYWDLTLDGPRLTDPARAEAELFERLREATRLRLVSDVPLGAFLSGGVDSSVVVATMAGLTSDPVKTFAIAFGDPSHDESAYAQRVAERYHTDHRTRQVDPDDMDLIDRLAGIFDEPFGDSSALPTFQVCKMARERVTVALSGDGGDELFAGYRRYLLHGQAERLRRLLPLGLRRPLFGLLARIYPKADWAPRWLRARTTLNELALDTAHAYARAVSATKEDVRLRLYSPDFLKRLDGYRATEMLCRHMERADTDDPVLMAQYADLKTWLPGGILVKVDRASMANSLEVRAPLLDRDLLEWSVRLAAPLKISGRQGKVVLKRVAEKMVDRDILYRPKQGFSMPLRRWFAGPLRVRLQGLAGENGRLADSGMFDMATVAEMVASHVNGARDHSAPLWLLLMFEAFLKGAGANS